MTLSTIKFTYQDKIDKLNVRIGRYQEIIEDYNVRINEAEKEDNPNISSVLKSKKQYEHKIENMERVKAYYQEFVDTADYLLQNLNNYNNVLSNLKYEDLERRNKELQEELEALETRVYVQNNELEQLGISHEVNKNKLKKQRSKMKEFNETKKLVKVLTNENEFLKERLKKVSKGSENSKKIKRDWYRERNKLIAENTSLRDTNDYLERRTQQLEDYCNHLSSRGSDESDMPVELNTSKNIFEQLRGGKSYGN